MYADINKFNFFKSLLSPELNPFILKEFDSQIVPVTLFFMDYVRSELDAEYDN